MCCSVKWKYRKLCLYMLWLFPGFKGYIRKKVKHRKNKTTSQYCVLKKINTQCVAHFSIAVLLWKRLQLYSRSYYYLIVTILQASYSPSASTAQKNVLVILRHVSSRETLFTWMSIVWNMICIYTSQTHKTIDTNSVLNIRMCKIWKLKITQYVDSIRNRTICSEYCSIALFILTCSSVIIYSHKCIIIHVSEYIYTRIRNIYCTFPLHIRSQHLTV